MEHIDKYQLEKLFLSPDDFSDSEKNEIKKHLELCASCRDYAGKLRDFYTALEENIDSEPTKEDKSFAEELLVKRRLALPIRGLEKRKFFDTYTEIIESYKRPVLQRFIRYIQYHPVKFAGATTFAAIVFALGVFFLTPTDDTNPAYAKINNYVLTVYNKESETLWKKSVIGIPDCSNDEKIIKEGLGQVFLRVGDIDGDNINEILIKGNSQHADFTKDTLYCFNNYGSLRWKTGYGKKIHFGELGKGQEGYEFIIDFIIIKLPKPRLFAIANIKGMAPSKLFEINTATGREMQAYHHRGGVLILDHWDFEKDGKEEILIAGLNDGLNHAFSRLRHWDTQRAINLYNLIQGDIKKS